MRFEGDINHFSQGCGLVPASCTVAYTCLTKKLLVAQQESTALQQTVAALLVHTRTDLPSVLKEDG